MYTETSRDLVSRARINDADAVVDLCGGTGTTAEVALEALPADARVYSVDMSSAMQAVGRRLIGDPRVTWVHARAENFQDQIPEPVDAVLCNSGIWFTDMTRVFSAARNALRPGGRLVFNINGSYVVLPKQSTDGPSPSLNSLVNDVAEHEFGYRPPPDGQNGRVLLTTESVQTSLLAAGLRVIDCETVSHEGTIEERRAWLSIPVFARPPGFRDHATLMEILSRAWSRVDQTGTVTTRWLVVTAEA